MKQRMMALLSVLALSVSICAMSALAGEGINKPTDYVEPPKPTESEEPVEEPVEEKPTTSATPESGAESPMEKPSVAGPDEDLTTDPDTGIIVTETVKIVPDEVGTVTFANVENRAREKNLSVLTLQANISSLEIIDYEDLSEDLRQMLNQIAQGQWMMVQMGQTNSYAYVQMGAQYGTIREQFEAIKDGEMQRENADVIRQLRHLQNQIILGAESTYIALSSLEAQEDGLQRQLTALNRSIEELELRRELGQVSALQVSQAKNGRASLISGLHTLQMNIQNLKLQLELLIGAELTGEIQLGQVPAVTQKELNRMHLEQDLLTFKSKSYDIFELEQTLEDAYDSYKNMEQAMGANSKDVNFLQAKHTWQAAQYTYNENIQNLELKFRTLYEQVMDYHQVWENAKVSLSCEQENYKVSKLKYEQGNISNNALLDAADTVKEAEEAVASAASDLFSAYNCYCWAVERGILN